jgi:hypothetical protein
VYLTRAAVLALALLGAACDNGPATTPTPDPPTVTETFTGTVTLNGSLTHDFTATAAGTITATITEITPSGAFIGFQMGTWSGAVCTAVLSNEAGTLSSILSANTQSSASLCVKLHDPNGILADNPVTYTVSVVHP